MKPVNKLSDAELIGEFHAVGHLADRLKEEGYSCASAAMVARRWSVLSEIRRRADLN